MKRVGIRTKKASLMFQKRTGNEEGIVPEKQNETQRNARFSLGEQGTCFGGNWYTK